MHHGLTFNFGSAKVCSPVVLGSSAIFADRGSFVRNELNSSWTRVNTQK